MIHLKRKLWIFVIIVSIVVSTVSCVPAEQAPTTTSPPQTTTIAINTPSRPYVISDSLVQVWIGSELESTGIAIGDGTQVLTVIDYELFAPHDVNVIAPDGTNYTASIERLDPRTGATLLAVAGMKLPPASLGSTDKLTDKTALVALWWGQPVITDFVMKPKLLTAGLSSSQDNPVSLTFNVYTEQDIPASFPYIRQGTIIADMKARVLGLVGVDYNKLFPHPSAPGMYPGVVRIESALELLIPDFAMRPYASGPLMIVITNEQATAILNGYFTNYEDITEVILNTCHQLGAALPAGEFPENSYDLNTNYKNGNSVTIVYARPIELTNTDGTVLAQAKWVIINWNRGDRKANQLFYGSGRMEPEGGFWLPDDLSALTKSLDSLAYHGVIIVP